jgi:formylglycine-generating enzyme required for sulfatase activity
MRFIVLPVIFMLQLINVFGQQADTKVFVFDYPMVLVESGNAKLGSLATEAGRSTNECQHEEKIRTFYIGKYEVTQAQWQSVMGNNPSKHTNCPECPVEQVAYEEVLNFIEKLREKTQEDYDLPDEENWEYAARGGQKASNYLYAGSNNHAEVAWTKSNSNGQTQAVGTKAANAIGIWDMSGNVREWTSTSHIRAFHCGEVSFSDEYDRSVKGGSWNTNAQADRVASRNFMDPNFRRSDVGFRLQKRVPYNPEIDGAPQYTIFDDSPPKHRNPKSTQHQDWYRDNDTLDFVYEIVKVEGGSMIMGSPKNEAGRETDECTNKVIVRPFQIGKYEVSQAQWEAVMQHVPKYKRPHKLNPSAHADCPDCPVESIEYEHIKTFIETINKLQQENYRLPSEKEWEFAARGGNKSKGTVFSGSKTAGKVAWHKSNATHSQPVGTKMPNEIGLYDMSGNVMEWCASMYRPYLCDTTILSPKLRIIKRGGSYESAENECRIADRDYTSAIKSHCTTGFRLSKDETPPFAFSYPMVQVEAGSFTTSKPFPMKMVEGLRDIKYFRDSSCQIKVELPTYQIGAYEVTHEQWKQVMGKYVNPYIHCHECPVERVSAVEVMAFIKALNGKTGRAYRLPTEEEWEFAARGGNKSRDTKYAGSDWLADVSWTQNESAGTRAVGAQKPNELGIYNLSGNVVEMCTIFKSGYPCDTRHAETDTMIALRGGCWRNGEIPHEIAFREKAPNTFKYDALGFRLVIESNQPVASYQPVEKVVTPKFTQTEIKQMGLQIPMVVIEAGKYKIGNPEGKQPAECQHEIVLDAYEMMTLEVTQAQWEAVMDRTPSDHPDCPNCPVTNVSCSEIDQFIKLLNQMAGSNYRLPSEQEWEVAARGGHKSQGFIYAGANDKAEFSSKSQVQHPYEVGTRTPNELGIYNMTGNVSEITSSIFKAYPCEMKYRGNGSYRVARGCSVENTDCSLSDRTVWIDTHGKMRDGGFRLARSLKK